MLWAQTRLRLQRCGPRAGTWARHGAVRARELDSRDVLITVSIRVHIIQNTADISAYHYMNAHHYKHL